MSALSPLDANSHAVSEERQDAPRSSLGKRKAILPLHQKPRRRSSKKRRGPLARKKAGIAKALSRKSAGPRPPKEVFWRAMRRICVASTHNCTFVVPDSRPDPQKSKLTDWSAGSPREALERAIAEWNSFDTARRPSLRRFCQGIGISKRTFPKGCRVLVDKARFLAWVAGGKIGPQPTTQPSDAAQSRASPSSAPR